MTEIEEKLQEICAWLNEYYRDGKPKDIKKYDEHIAISFWECGAIICIEDLLFFIEEFDGSWNADLGALMPFSIEHIESFNQALTNLQEYVKENGIPVCHANSSIVNHYKL